MIIARRATYLKELEEQIAKDEAKLKPKPKPKKTHTLEKCSCGALLSKNKVAKHLKTRFHQEALDKRTPTEQLNDRLDKLENDIETAIAKEREENKTKPGPSEQFFGQKQQPRATTPPKVRIVNLLKEKAHLQLIGSSPANPTARNQDADGGNTSANRNPVSAQTVSTQGSRQDPETTF